MQHAEGWKRILNQGLPSFPRCPERDQVEHAIITATTVVGPLVDLESTHANDPIRWEMYKGLTFPFNRFWLEWLQSDEAICGNLITVDMPNAGDWKLDVVAFAGSPKTPMELIGRFDTLIHPDGSPVLDARFTIRIDASISKRVLAVQQRDAIESTLLTQLSVIFDVLMILGCKNVSLKDHEGDRKQTSRAAKRHGGQPEDYRYRTLVVRPAGSKSDAPSQAIDVIPRHVCRGHFSEYGPEFNKGLLFGRYAGRFYVPSHMRGQKKHGVVEKDYIAKNQEGE